MDRFPFPTRLSRRTTTLGLFTLSVNVVDPVTIAVDSSFSPVALIIHSPTATPLSVVLDFLVVKENESPLGPRPVMW